MNLCGESVCAENEGAPLHLAVKALMHSQFYHPLDKKYLKATFNPSLLHSGHTKR